MLDDRYWDEYVKICEDMGISASAGLRQMVKRVVKGHRENG